MGNIEPLKPRGHYSLAFCLALFYVWIKIVPLFARIFITLIRLYHVTLGGAHLVSIFHFCVVLTFPIYLLCIFLMGPLVNNKQNIEVSPFGLLEMTLCQREKEQTQCLVKLKPQTTKH